MGQKCISDVAWKAERLGLFANKAADPLHYPLRNFPLPHVEQQLCWYYFIKGPGHLE
jgi:hypothetical protein